MQSCSCRDVWLRLLLSSLWLKWSTFHSSVVSLCGRTGIRFRWRWSVWCLFSATAFKRLSQTEALLQLIPGFWGGRFQNNPRRHDHILWSWHRNWTAGWNSYSVTVSKASHASFPPQFSSGHITSTTDVIKSMAFIHLSDCGRDYVKNTWQIFTKFACSCSVQNCFLHSCRQMMIWCRSPFLAFFFSLCLLKAKLVSFFWE